MRIYLFLIFFCLACPHVIAQSKLIVAESFQKKGLINSATFEVIVPYLYQNIEEGSDGTFLASQEKDAKGETLYVYYDAKGKEFLRYKSQTSTYSPFSEGLAVFGNFKDDIASYEYGYINKKGQIIVQPKYTALSNFIEGVGVAKAKDRIMLIDAEGKIITALDTNYSYVSEFSEGRAFAIYGYAIGSDYFPLPYPSKSDYLPFEGEIVMIDKQGKIVADFRENKNITNAKKFQQGLAVVVKTDPNYYRDTIHQPPLFGVVDRAGKFILPLEYAHIEIEPTGTVLATRASGEVMLFDKAGKPILNQGETKPYYVISPLFGGRFRFIQENSQEKRWGVMDMSNNNKMVVPMQYEEIYFRPPTDFWAIPQWNLLKVEADNPDGSWETTHTAKEGKVDFYTYTRVVNSDKIMKVYHRPQSMNSLLAFQLDQKWGLIEQFTIKTAGFDAIEPFAWTMPSDLIGVQKRGKWGYLNTKGEEAIPFQYDALTAFENGITPVRKGKKWGLIAKNNKPITAFDLDSIVLPKYSFEAQYLYRKNHTNAHFQAQKNGFWGLIDAQGKTALPFEYLELDTKDPHYFVAKHKTGKIGASDYAGKILLPYEYDEIVAKYEESSDLFLPENVIFVAIKNNQRGLVNLKNEILISFEYDEITPFLTLSDAWYIKKNQKIGIYKAGKIALPTEYDKIEIVGDYIKIWQAGKLGLLRKDFTQVLPCAYQDIGNYYSFYDKYPNPIPFKQNGLLGIFSKDWKVLIEPMFEDIEMYNENIVIAKKGGKYGVTNMENKGILPFEYDVIEYRYDESAHLRLAKNNKEGIASLKGEIKVPLTYDEIGHFTLDKGLYMGAKQKGKWGYINQKRKFVIPAVYEDAKLFEKIGGVPHAIVRKNGKWGVINAKNKVIIPFQYDDMRWEEFEKGALYVTEGEKGKYIDLAGKEIKK